MRLVEPSVREIVQEPGMDGVYKIIRDSAAVCYQTDTESSRMSPQDFVENVIIKNGHTRALEFATIYMKLAYDGDDGTAVNDIVDFYMYNRYSTVCICEDAAYITTNFRVITQGNYATDYDGFLHGYDKNRMADLKYMCEPTKYHRKRYVFAMNVSRGCSDDFRTHVSLSSMCESSRFCNYKNDKFGNSITFIKPYWFGKSKIKDSLFKIGMWTEERVYMFCANVLKLKAQQLKRLFPLGAKAELRLCGFDYDWPNFLWRRCDTHADPECVNIARQIKYLIGCRM